MGCCCSFPRGDGSTLTSAAETVDVLLSAHKVDDHTPKDVVGEVTTDRHSVTSLKKCDHKSHYGHELVYKYLMEQKGFKFISHDEPYKGRQPDLMFWWLRGTTKVLVIVEVKDMRKNTQDAKREQVEKLLDQCERYKGNIQIVSAAITK